MDFQLKWLVPNFMRSVYRSCVIADLTSFFFFSLIQSIYGEPLKEDILSRHSKYYYRDYCWLILIYRKKKKKKFIVKMKNHHKTYIFLPPPPPHMLAPSERKNKGAAALIESHTGFSALP